MHREQIKIISRKKSEKGQVALFVALSFPILFLFFAMVINVGLLVHHKINLQNSVDLAAYYGAMKQAESMNAIAHVNYQVRQSWKLLAWRYRMLGTAGDFEEHPYDKVTRKVGPGGDGEDINQGKKDFYDAPAFCLTYVPFKPMPPGENSCKNLVALSGIDYFKPPAVLIDLPNISKAVQEFTLQATMSVKQRCEQVGALNYRLLGNFVVAFNMDQAARMQLINYLSKSISPSRTEADFYDLDGKSVHQGIKTTLKNNLTAANNDDGNLDIKIYNSLGDPNCNSASVPKGAPAKWLKPIKINPGFIYVDTKCDVSVQPVAKNLDTSLPFHTANSPQNYLTEINELKQYIGVRPDINDIYNMSVGVEKNPWCMAYVGVSATATPKIPFAPLGGVTLKAQAFYKPFGGRIGPWYKNIWPANSPNSEGQKLDELLPPRVFEASQFMNDPADKTRAANYSRYIGDQIGLKSRRVLFQFGRAIFGLDPNWSATGTAIVSSAASSSASADGAPNFDHWRHLPFNFASTGGTGDSLAWNSEADQPSRMRHLELAGILPDAFDMAYYSIEPDFYSNYYKRIRDGFLKGPGAAYAQEFELLGDLGMHPGYKSGNINFDEFSVMEQYKTVYGSDFVKDNLKFDDKLTYISKKWADVLTGWAPKSLSDYSLDTGKFGKCTDDSGGSDGYKKLDPPSSGNCVKGGRTGYSVKMVSSDYLQRTDLNLGGRGQNGPLKNPFKGF